MSRTKVIALSAITEHQFRTNEDGDHLHFDGFSKQYLLLNKCAVEKPVSSDILKQYLSEENNPPSV